MIINVIQTANNSVFEALTNDAEGKPFPTYAIIIVSIGGCVLIVATVVITVCVRRKQSPSQSPSDGALNNVGQANPEVEANKKPEDEYQEITEEDLNQPELYLHPEAVVDSYLELI